jgi:predicted NAD-dependent protein-ADP-ribosyltransferase YbiA (DUF1768 family)
MGAKMAGNPYRATHSRKDWDTIRLDVRQLCLHVKLAQHRETFGALLLSTGTRSIVEESHRTDFWAAKATAEDAGTRS